MVIDLNPGSRSEEEICEYLRAWGARKLRSVRLRANRSTIWSLTKGGRQLNLHRAFAAAPLGLLRNFVAIVNDGGLASPVSRAASRTLWQWEPLHRDLARVRSQFSRHETLRGRGRRAHCCATPSQREYLRTMYRYLNRARFGACLPEDVPLRLSSRMKSRLGQMMPGEMDGVRHVVELALNLDLMLPGNDEARLDTLVHEMAHVADWLIDGEVGHGPTWRRWAGRAGCEARACTSRRIIHRRRGQSVTRVPPLPLAARIRLPPRRSGSGSSRRDRLDDVSALQ